MSFLQESWPTHVCDDFPSTSRRRLLTVAEMVVVTEPSVKVVAAEMLVGAEMSCLRQW